jgi:hypothetical protein
VLNKQKKRIKTRVWKNEDEMLLRDRSLFMEGGEGKNKGGPYV